MPSGSSKQGTPEDFRYVHSDNFPSLLESARLSLCVTTYQAGKLMVVRAGDGRLSTLLRSFDRPMGLSVRPDQSEIVLGARREVWTFRSEPGIAPRIPPAGRHDACFVPRRSHVTGDIQGHEIGFVDDSIWIVNTLFSCLCSLDDRTYSFVPRWRPPFVDQLTGEDRCHLNGMAIEDGKVRYVSAMGETNDAGGWRANKHEGGVLIDIESDEVITRGLCMPHSPRLHRGELFVLDSGEGRLCHVDQGNGARTEVAAVPGYARGLAMRGDLAFVGLSQIREKDHFGGLPIADRYSDDERRCGVWVLDLQSGQTVAFLQFAAGVTEIFDIQLLTGLTYPSVIGLQNDTLDAIMTAPPAVWAKDAKLG